MSDSSLVNDSYVEPDASILATRPWVKYYESGVPVQLDIPDQPLPWLLEQTASHYPGQTALIYYGHKTSYSELLTLARRFAHALLRLGIKKGERVAIALPNIPQYPIAFYGVLLAG